MEHTNEKNQMNQAEEIAQFIKKEEKKEPEKKPVAKAENTRNDKVDSIAPLQNDKVEWLFFSKPLPPSTSAGTPSVLYWPEAGSRTMTGST